MLTNKNRWTACRISLLALCAVALLNANAASAQTQSDRKPVRTEKKLMDGGPMGSWCRAGDFDIPLVFQNIGNRPLTIIHHLQADTYEIKGTARLLPVGKTYMDETVKLGPMDCGSVARMIDAAGKLDWGNMQKRDIAEMQGYLSYCRAVAQVEAKLPITGWKGPVIGGEPAMLMYRGDERFGGSWGAAGTDLRFRYVGPGKVEMYQLEPSGRFKVVGTVQVVQNGELCKNGIIGKDGHVISTEM